jgi:hypothetical protein
MTGRFERRAGVALLSPLAVLLLTVSMGFAAQPFSCKISADGKSVAAAIANPYKRDASCQVNCQISTTKAGTSFQVSCTKEIPPGGETVLCTKSFDGGRLVKMIGGSGSCMNPEPPPEDADKDDEDVQKLITDPNKLREHVRKDLPPDAQKMLDQMNKP